jgi:hypothetical protein
MWGRDQRPDQSAVAAVAAAKGNAMRSILKFIVLAGAALGIVATASAVPSNDANNKDSVQGAGQVLTAPGDGSVPNNRLEVTAKSGPAGEDPQGKVSFKALADKPAFSGDVVCLRVEGNRATILFSLDKTKEGPERFEDGGALVFIEDNGNPSGGVSPDRQRNFRLTPVQFEAQKLAGCPAPISPTRNLESGNLTVRDAT